VVRGALSHIARPRRRGSSKIKLSRIRPCILRAAPPQIETVRAPLFLACLRRSILVATAGAASTALRRRPACMRGGGPAPVPVDWWSSWPVRSPDGRTGGPPLKGPKCQGDSRSIRGPHRSPRAPRRQRSGGVLPTLGGRSGAAAWVRRPGPSNPPSLTSALARRAFGFVLPCRLL
jgi:hypothetical protein